MNKNNIIGKTINNWTFIAFDHYDKIHHPFYKCRCNLCGNIYIIDYYRILYGMSTKCRKCSYKYRHKGLKFSKTRQYIIYTNMKQRCYNNKNPHYKWYGAKGIKICNEWLKNFKTFYKWSLENGYEDNLTIDRIDYTKDYCPENCRWTTLEEHANNKSSNRYIIYKGEKLSVAKFCRKYGLNEDTTRERINVYKILDPELLIKKDLRGIKKNKYFATINNQTKSISEWCELFEINRGTIISRITKYGYTPEEALTKKLKNGKYNKFLTG